MKNMITSRNEFVKYHDDMYDDEVKILPFPYSDYFADFRVFNGISLEQMDDFLGRIREIMIEIANIHAQNEREVKLRKEVGK